MPTVRGEIELPADAPDSAAAVRVRVEDVSRADASSVVVGEQVLRDVSLRECPTRFEVAVEQVDPNAHYSVRVHVDVEGTGRLSSGDLLSTVTVPVLTRGAPDTVTVPVIRLS